MRLTPDPIRPHLWTANETFVGFKSVNYLDGNHTARPALVELAIPAGTLVHGKLGGKMRAASARVLSITTVRGRALSEAYSARAHHFRYQTGAVIRPDSRYPFCLSARECAAGIHFWSTPRQANAWCRSYRDPMPAAWGGGR